MLLPYKYTALCWAEIKEYCNVLYCIVLYCIVLHCIASHRIALIALYCIVLFTEFHGESFFVEPSDLLYAVSFYYNHDLSNL